MYYSDTDNYDIDYPIDNYNFRKKQKSPKERISNFDSISVDDDLYDDDEYERN